MGDSSPAVIIFMYWNTLNSADSMDFIINVIVKYIYIFFIYCIYDCNLIENVHLFLLCCYFTGPEKAF